MDVGEQRDEDGLEGSVCQTGGGSASMSLIGDGICPAAEISAVKVGDNAQKSRHQSGDKVSGNCAKDCAKVLGSEGSGTKNGFTPVSAERDSSTCAMKTGVNQEKAVSVD